LSNKKDVIIAVLATFCLTAIIFMALPIRSANNSYDPWLDYNGDGKISLSDLVTLAQSYGTTGNPAKNVYVTNPSYAVAAKELNISWTNTYGASLNWHYTPAGYGWTGGYSKIFIHLLGVDEYPLSVLVNNTVYVSSIAWNSSADIASIEQFNPSKCNITIPYGLSSTVGDFEIKAETIEWISFTVTSTTQSGWVDLEVHTYLTN
jgi:hypothetical protein